MRLRKPDAVLQIVEKLRALIPQNVSPKLADVVVMQNAQKDIELFFASAQQSKIMVSYSGSTSEGGRSIGDWKKTIDGNMQERSHTIEVHICAKKYMVEILTAPKNTMLDLMDAVEEGLVGLKFCARKIDGTIDREQPLTDSIFHLETFFDSNYMPGTVAVCRFQATEFLPHIEEETTFGIFEEITYNEYSQQTGEDASVSGSPNDTLVVQLPAIEE